DGIRDRNVTGVQTCALPISIAARFVACAALGCAAATVDGASVTLHQDAVTTAVTRRLFTDNGRRMLGGVASSCNYAYAERPVVKIGRASCRERVEGAVGAGS